MVIRRKENLSKELIDSSLNYLGKIFESQPWDSIEWALKIPLSKWNIGQLSEVLQVKFDDVLEKIKENEKKKPEKLKEMVIRYWIHETISREEWEEYERRNDWDWIVREVLNTLFREETLEGVNEENKERYKGAIGYCCGGGSVKKVPTTLMGTLAKWST